MFKYVLLFLVIACSMTAWGWSADMPSYWTGECQNEVLDIEGNVVSTSKNTTNLSPEIFDRICNKTGPTFDESGTKVTGSFKSHCTRTASQLRARRTTDKGVVVLKDEMELSEDTITRELILYFDDGSPGRKMSCLYHPTPIL